MFSKKASKLFYGTLFICTLLGIAVAQASSGIWDRAVTLSFGTATTYPGQGFNTQALGSYVNTAAYYLKGGYIKTYKNGSDDITGARMFYRVIPSGSNQSIPFTTVVLPFFQNLSGTPGDQQWKNDTLSVAFMSGLSPGNYFLEVYFEADFTYNGGSGTHIDNNNATNYKASFSIISAPPNCSVSLGNDTAFCGASGVTLGGNFTTTPDGDSLTITYDATQGQSGLVGASKVYFHSGYELTAGAGAVNWVGNWGTDDGLGKMDSLGNNLWRITLHTQSYYNLAPGTLIHGLFFVFRNADGTATGKDTNGNDIFMLYGSTPTSSFQGVTGVRYIAPYTGVLWSNGATSPSLPVSETGTYWLQVTYSNGCVASDTVQIQSGALPAVNISGNTQICQGQSTVLTADGNYSSYQWSNGSTGNSITVNSAGEYTVSVTNSQGCTGIDVAFVNQIPEPIADFSFSIFNTNTVNFSILNPLPGQTYRWNFGNGNTSTVTGTAASQTYTSNGVYQVRLVVQNVCGTDTIVRTVGITGVGLEDQFSSGCKIYPQPVAGHLYVELAQGSTPLTAWQLKDICGNVLQEEAVNSTDRLVVPMESYAPGVYLLTLKNGPSILTKKIIKQ